MTPEQAQAQIDAELQADADQDGNLVTGLKSFLNELDPRRIGGNLADYGGDVMDLARYGVVLPGKPTDQWADEMRAKADKGALKISRKANASVLDEPTNPLAWSKLLGSGAGSIVQVGTATALGGPGAGIAAGAGLSISSTKDAAREAGVSDTEAAVAASILAPVVGVLEQVGLGFITKNKAATRLLETAIVRRALAYGEGKLAKTAVVKAAAELLPQVVKRYAGRAVTGAAGESVTEGLQTALELEGQVVADKLRGNPEAPAGEGRYGTTQRDVARGVGEAMAAAAVLGGGGGVLSASAQGNAAEVAPAIQPAPAALARPEYVAEQDFAAAREQFPQPVSVKTPEGEVLHSNVQVVELSTDGTIARIVGVDSSGAPLETAVPVAYITEQSTAEADAAVNDLSGANAQAGSAPTDEGVNSAASAQNIGVSSPLTPDEQVAATSQQLLDSEGNLIPEDDELFNVALPTNATQSPDTEENQVLPVDQQPVESPESVEPGMADGQNTSQEPGLPLDTAPLSTPPENVAEVGGNADVSAPASSEQGPVRQHTERYDEATQNALTDAERYRRTTSELLAAADVDGYLAATPLDDAYERAQLSVSQAIPAGMSEDEAQVAHAKLRQKVGAAYKAQAAELLAAGDKAGADRATERYVRMVGARAQQATGAAQVLRDMVGAAGVVGDLVTAEDPEATAEKTVDAMLGDIGRNNAAAEKQNAVTAKAATKQAKVQRKQAVQAAVASEAVQTAVAEVAAEQRGDAPAKASRKEEIAQVRAERKGLFDKLKRLNNSFGIVPQEEERARLHIEIFRTYIKEGVLQVKELVSRFRADAGSYEATDDELNTQAEAAVEQAVRQESAESVATRVLGRLQPATAGVFDPLRELVNTLTGKVNEKLDPKAKGPKKLAREAIAHALQNRQEYADVYEQSKKLVEQKIEQSKASDATKAKWRKELDAYYQEHIGQSYADTQFARAYREALAAALPDGRTRQNALRDAATGDAAQLDALRQQVIDHVTADLNPASPERAELAAHVGKTFDADVMSRRQKEAGRRYKALPARIKQLVDDALATSSDADLAATRAELQQKVARGLSATDSGTAILMQKAGEVFDALVEAKQQQARNKAGVYDQGQSAPQKRQNTRHTLPERLTRLYAARATDEQVAGRLAGDFATRGVKDLGKTVARIAREHAGAIDEYGQTLKDRLLGDPTLGLTPQQASKLADAVEAAYKEQVKASKIKELARRVQSKLPTTEKRATQQAIDKLVETLNIGEGLDAADYAGQSPAEALLKSLLGNEVEISATELAQIEDLKRTYIEAAQRKAATIGGKTVTVANTEAVTRAATDLMRAVGQLKGVDKMRKSAMSDALWYAFILSNPATHARNFKGNVVQAAAEQLLINLPYAVGKTRGLLGGQGLRGFGAGTAEGFAKGVNIFGSGYQKGGGEKFVNNAPLEKAEGMVPRLFKYVTRALGASDAFSYQQHATSRYYELATYRGMELARQNPGLSALEVRRKALAYADEQLFRTTQALADIEAIMQQEGVTLPTAAQIKADPKAAARQWVDYQVRKGDLLNQARAAENPEWAKEADDYARRMTFNADYEGHLGYIGWKIGDFLNGSDSDAIRVVGKVLTPFAKVVTNVQVQRLEWAGLGLLRAINGSVGGRFAKSNDKSSFYRKLTPEERVKSAMRSVYGIGSAFALYSLASAGTIAVTGFPTGNRDEDKEKPPFSIRIGGKWITYKDSSFEIPLLLLNKHLAYETKQAQGEDPALLEDMLGIYAATVGTWAVSTGPVSGPADFFSAVSDAKQNERGAIGFFERATKNAIKSRVVPGVVTGIFQFYDQMADLPAAEKRSNSLYRRFMTTIFGDVPYWHGGGEEAIDVLGDVMRRGDEGEVKRTPEKQGVVDFLALNHLMPKAPAPTAPELALYDPLGEKVEALSDSEYKEFMIVRGRALYTVLTTPLRVDAEMISRLRRGDPSLGIKGIGATGMETMQMRVAEGDAKAAKKVLTKAVHEATDAAKKRVLELRAERGAQATFEKKK
ncbi:hypothetical protein [Hymenobacter glacieicola]|uniref:hypothetical protein n=1 Tax=Hymenobacter glacieicola TaxID=1562124 RepID=UPI001E581D26|nr:hypothetical protein [Hymenobacter glacieicola]